MKIGENRSSSINQQQQHIFFSSSTYLRIHSWEMDENIVQSLWYRWQSHIEFYVKYSIWEYSLLLAVDVHNQSINQPTNQPTNQPINLSINLLKREQWYP